MSIDEMEAGPELDRLVAVEVMGRCYMMVDGYRADEKQQAANRVLPYSTDIAAAWEVVEKMRHEGWHFHIFSDMEYRDANVWSATFMRHGDRSASGIGHIASLAICRAALKAVRAAKEATK